ncbi:hypothetical protein BKI52_09605 [marine bacterium AO1-C]|nr:hypothetical protein BKI52_09605 [marine bacterium AO1-C]
MTLKNYLPYLVLFLAFTFTAQQAIGQERIYKMAQNPPKPKRGLEAFHEHVTQNVQKYKSGARGNVFVQFVVEKDGKLSNIKVLKGVGNTNKAVIKALETAPRWLPGKQNGRPVRVQKILAVKIG